jgi:hypothetical protein
MYRAVILPMDEVTRSALQLELRAVWRFRGPEVAIASGQMPQD